MNSKFMPQMPASVVIMAKMAAHAASFLLTSLCSRPISDMFTCMAIRMPSRTPSSDSVMRCRWSCTSRK